MVLTDWNRQSAAPGIAKAAKAIPSPKFGAYGISGGSFRRHSLQG